MWKFALKTMLMMSATAIVSPSARPKPEQRGTDDPAATERQDDVADHPPPCAAECERALALLAWAPAP